MYEIEKILLKYHYSYGDSTRNIHNINIKSLKGTLEHFWIGQARDEKSLWTNNLANASVLVKRNEVCVVSVAAVLFKRARNIRGAGSNILQGKAWSQQGGKAHSSDQSFLL